MYLHCVCRPVIDLTSILNLNIFKQNMLGLDMQIWTDCKHPFIECMYDLCYWLYGSNMSVIIALHSEWAVNIQRDSYASYVGHYPMLAYFAIAENESIGRERYNFMQVCSFGILYFFSL